MLSLLRPPHVVVFALLVLGSVLRGQSTSLSSSPAGTISLLQPLGLAYDAQGNLFFAEAGNHVIRRLDSSGTLSTVAGTGAQGFSGDGNLATSAQLDTPHAVAVDSAGNLFLADTQNQRIRRIDVVTRGINTVAGTGISGFSGDGTAATGALLASPVALALDSSSLYIADSRNHRIRRVDLQSGIITTVAGTGTQGFRGDGGLATAAALDTPSGLALDASGTLFLADTGNHRVRRIDPLTHIITTVAGGSAASILLRPVSLAISPAGVLIADAAQQRVLELNTASGLLSSIAGQGSQSFRGDTGPAAMAMLDTPSAIAVAPSEAITLADTGNQRLRQITIDGSISTIAGLGTLLNGSLTLSGPTTQSYGATALTVAMSAASTIAGVVSLLEVGNGSSALVSQANLSTGVARFSLPTLAAGTHHLIATFPGDSTHRAAQSQSLALTVAPLPLTAILAGSAVVLYGQPIPPLTATLSGDLASDAEHLIATVTTTASPGSSPGSYPVQITLSGLAASNYTFTPPTAALTITKAPVLATFTQVADTLTVHIVPTTSGIPTGSITLLTSAGTHLSTVLLDAAGSAAVSTSTLGNGTYTLTALYSGDTDFLSAQTPTVNLTLGPPVTPPDFSFTASSATQTVNAGATAAFAVAVKTSGSSLAGPIVLSAGGLPPNASANFDPAVIPPGGAVTGFTLSVATPRALAESLRPESHRRSWITIALLSPLVLVGRSRHRRRMLLASLAALALCGCGDRINAASSQGSITTIYPIVVTGTTTNLDGTVLQHTATVTLVIQ